MDNFLDSVEQRVQFATVTYRGEQIHLVVEYLPTSNQCDWVVWKHGLASCVRSKKDFLYRMPLPPLSKPQEPC